MAVIPPVEDLFKLVKQALGDIENYMDEAQEKSARVERELTEIRQVLRNLASPVSSPVPVPAAPTEPLAAETEAVPVVPQNEKNFVCPTCAVGLKNKDSLRRHLAKKHKDMI